MNGWIDLDLTSTIQAEQVSQGGDGVLSVRVRSLVDLGDQSFIFYNARETAWAPHLEIEF